MNTGQAILERALEQLSWASTWDDWPKYAERFIRAEIAAGRVVDADRVREACGDPSRPAMLGAVFRSLAQGGVIRRVTVRAADRPSRRAGLLSVWGPS